MELPDYKEMNGIRVFNKDFKVRRGIWNGETIERCSIVKTFDEGDFGYYLVRAYAVTSDGNRFLGEYFNRNFSE